MLPTIVAMIINPNEMMRKTSNSKDKKKREKKVSKRKRKRKKLARKEKLAKKYNQIKDKT